MSQGTVYMWTQTTSKTRGIIQFDYATALEVHHEVVPFKSNIRSALTCRVEGVLQLHMDRQNETQTAIDGNPRRWTEIIMQVSGRRLNQSHGFDSLSVPDVVRLSRARSLILIRLTIIIYTTVAISVI